MSSRRGALLRSNGPVLGDKVYYVNEGTRHWVVDSAWLGDNGFVWPDDVEIVEENVLLATKLGRPAPRRWTVGQDSDWHAQDHQAFREMGCSFLQGSGIEFGAGSSPLPIPLDVHVEYADRLSYDELLANLYPGQTPEAMIRPTYKVGIDQLDLLPNPVDFIASAHVIQHVRDPIGTIIRASDKLKSGGLFLLFVPDMAETFDRNRDLTTLDHVMMDYFAPSRERDAEHFQEFYSRAFVTADGQFEDVWREAWESEAPIHFHTWTYDSFEKMIKWVVLNSRQYVSYFSQRTYANEFFFLLVKAD